MNRFYGDRGRVPDGLESKGLAGRPVKFPKHKFGGIDNQNAQRPGAATGKACPVGCNGWPTARSTGHRNSRHLKSPYGRHCRTARRCRAWGTQWLRPGGHKPPGRREALGQIRNGGCACTFHSRIQTFLVCYRCQNPKSTQIRNPHRLAS